MAAHPWLTDATLANHLKEYSPELGHLISLEQEFLKKSWCANFLRGDGIVNPKDESTSYTWEFIVRHDADEYRVKRLRDSTEFRLVLLQQSWLLFQGDDYGQLIAKGVVMASPDSRSALP